MTRSTSSAAAAAAASKGADYRLLIEEARPDVDDAVPDEFSQALASMLSLRGDAILAWSAHDDFLGDAASTPEASFLSLNLNLLADQLESIDLSRRLFIDDPDLLPPDLVRSQLPPPNPTVVVAEAPPEPAKLNAELEKLLDSLGDSLVDDDPVNPKAVTLDDDFDSWLDTL